MQDDPLFNRIRQLPDRGPPATASETIRAQMHQALRHTVRLERLERWLRRGEVLLAAAVAVVYLRWAAQTTSLLGL